MKLELLFEEIYPHPIEKVWRALTDSAALASWLMTNDFEPRAGKRFTLRGAPDSGWRGFIECEVIEIEPPVRMVWSWLSTDEGQPTRVEFRLEAVEAGTRLNLSHTGDVNPSRRARLATGWPAKLAQLGSDLKAAI
jgi:uncharacterized protein YndB with AHSA1/START domain